MTDKQPEALRLADVLMRDVGSQLVNRKQAAALIRTQHAEIERLNAAATDSNLILERAQATNLEMLAAIERKDALLRQCLKHVASNISMTSDGTEAEDLYDAITKELQ